MADTMQTSAGMRWLLQATAKGLAISKGAQKENPVPESQWPEVLALMTWHRLGPVVLEGQIKEPLRRIPEPWQENIRALVADGTRQNLMLCQQLLALHQQFEEAQIPYLVLKGLPLAMQAFGNLGSRLARDIDLLISPKSYERTVVLLKELGFQLKEPLFPYPAPLRWAYTSGEIWEKGAVLLDLHCSLNEPGAPFPIDLEKILRDPQRVKIGGEYLPVLPPETQFLFLANHAAKHLWMRFFWIVDMIALCKASAINWPEVLAQAKALGMRRRLEMSLQLAADLFDWEIPPGAGISETSMGNSASWRREWRRFALENRDYAKSLVLQNPPTRVFQWSRRLTDRWQDRWVLFAAWLFKPLAADVLSMPLPQKLRFLYWLWRPIRLGTRFLKR